VKKRVGRLQLNRETIHVLQSGLTWQGLGTQPPYTVTELPTNVYCSEGCSLECFTNTRCTLGC
jgi:hypothetical protein